MTILQKKNNELKHSANYKYYAKEDLGNGKSRYYYSREEWEAAHKNSGSAANQAALEAARRNVIKEQNLNFIKNRDAAKDAERKNDPVYINIRNGRATNPYDKSTYSFNMDAGHDYSKYDNSSLAFGTAIGHYWDANAERFGVTYPMGKVQDYTKKMEEEFSIDAKDYLVKQAEYAIDLYEKDHDNFIKDLDNFYNLQTKDFRNEENKKWVKELCDNRKKSAEKEYNKAKEFVKTYKNIKSRNELRDILYDKAVKNVDDYYKRMKNEYGNKWNYSKEDIWNHYYSYFGKYKG